ncbi:hypothetical protein [Legionella gresilensis]|uniref:hypothetical protein n=1 Tax=Legionella gresilensis TaxID=91823 RepID=UPI001F5E8096|nr:hypothetical protein [Legionella gresilensis]
MTRFADDVKPYPLANGFLKANEERQKPKGRIIKQSNGQMVWVRQNAGDNSWA